MEYKYVHGGPYEKSDEIRQYQERLNHIRTTFHGNWSYLQPDGVFGRKTRDALKNFQIFVSVSVTGNLDTATQKAIDSKYYECQRGYSADPNSSRGYNPNMTYADQGYVDIADHTTNPTPPQTKPGNLSFTESGTAFPSSYGIPDKDSFIEKYKGLFGGFFSDLWGIFDSLRDKPARELATYVMSQIRALANKLGYIGMEVSQDFTRLKSVSAKYAKEIYNSVKNYGSRLISKIKTNPAEISSLAKKATKGAGKGSAIGLAIAGLPMIYYLIRWIIAKATGDPEKDYYYNNFISNLKGFIGTCIVCAIGYAIAVGIVAAGVASAPVTAVVAVVGLVIAIVDILVMVFSGKGIGDWIMEGFDWVGNRISETASAIHDYIFGAPEPAVAVSGYAR